MDEKFDFDMSEFLGATKPDNTYIAGYNKDKTTRDEIDISLLVPSPFHPIPLYGEEKEKEMVESIKAFGVLQPILIRESKIQIGKYEILNGRNRVHCSELAGKTTIPYILEEYSDADAQYVTLDAIIQQRGFNDLKFSERAEIVHLPVSYTHLDVYKRQVVAQAVGVKMIQPGAGFNKGAARLGHFRAVHRHIACLLYTSYAKASQ